MRARPLVAVSSLLLGSLCAQNGLWAQLTFPASPAARIGAVMTYDSARDRLVLVGGTPNQTFAFAQTWENDGAQWLLRTTTGPVGSSFGYPTDFLAAAYDSQRQRVVAVEFDYSSMRTWEWNGTAWALRANGSVPPGRDGFALAYDSARGRTVMFGGNDGINELSDTWEWDGTVWLQRGSGGPAPRHLHTMAFDSVRGVTVLFGGRRESPSQVFGDTWEWNGSSWFEHFGVTGPAARHDHCMAFDAARGVSVVQGGRGSADYVDTWEWNGTVWTNRQATMPSHMYTAMAYDAARARVVAFGGRALTNGGVYDHTFAYTATAIAAAVTAYGAGCAGPTGVPLLAALPGSVPRLGSTLQLRMTGLPTGGLDVPIGWVGFDDAQWNGIPLPLALDPLGFPGCSALLAPVSAYTLSNLAGTADWPLAIPFLPAFAGFEFFVQGGVLVLGFNPGGLVFTRALACTVGR